MQVLLIYAAVLEVYSYEEGFMQKRDRRQDSKNYSRYRQGIKSQDGHTKLKEFLNPQNSEILSACRWLLNSFST